MWYENLAPARSWTSLIGEYVSCQCAGIRKADAPCPACKSPPYDPTPQWVNFGNGERRCVMPAFNGAEGRVEDYHLLALMEREWTRPLNPTATPSWLTSGTSERATVVLLFWIYFESRIRRVIDIGLQCLSDSIRHDLLSRYGTVTAHMRTLYEILFGLKYVDDLKSVGAEEIGGHLARVQDARNRFMHGEPQALSDKLVTDVVHKLKDEHDAWIAVYNRRITLAANP